MASYRWRLMCLSKDLQTLFFPVQWPPQANTVSSFKIKTTKTDLFLSYISCFETRIIHCTILLSVDVPNNEVTFEAKPFVFVHVINRSSLELQDWRKTFTTKHANDTRNVIIGMHIGNQRSEKLQHQFCPLFLIVNEPTALLDTKF